MYVDKEHLREKKDPLAVFIQGFAAANDYIIIIALLLNAQNYNKNNII